MSRLILNILATVVLLFSLMGCGAEKKVVSVTPKSLPNWYTSPPLSNNSELFALGEGKNKTEAITNALNLMASTLSVSISSEFNAKTVVKEGRVNSSEGIYSNDVTSSVKEIRISSYEVLYSESLGFKRYAVLIKSNKKKLFESMLLEMQQESSVLKSRMKSIQNSNGLQKLSFYKKSLDSLSGLQNRIVVMAVLQPSFDGKVYLQQMQAVEAEYIAVRKALSFSLSSDKGGEHLKAPIAKGLATKEIQITKTKSTPMHFRTSITTDIQEANAYGFTLARTTITLTTRDYSRKVVGSNSFNLVGQSTQGYGVAKQNLAMQLNEMIDKEGIAKVLGLDI